MRMISFICLFKLKIIYLTGTASQKPFGGIACGRLVLVVGAADSFCWGRGEGLYCWS